MTAGPLMRVEMNLSSSIVDRIECTCEQFTLILGLSRSENVKSILKLLENLRIAKISYLRSNINFDASGNMDEGILQLYKMTAGSSMSADIELSPELKRGEWIDCTKENVGFFLGLQSSVNLKNILSLLDKMDIIRIDSIFIMEYDFFDAMGNVDENILKIYEQTAGPSMRTVVKLSSRKQKGEIICTSEELKLDIHSPLSSNISLPDFIKMTTGEFSIDITNYNVLQDDAVSIFLQEITKYSIEHRKNIWFYSSVISIYEEIISSHASFIKGILSLGMIDIESEYVHFHAREP